MVESYLHKSGERAAPVERGCEELVWFEARGVRKGGETGWSHAKTFLSDACVVLRGWGRTGACR